MNWKNELITATSADDVEALFYKRLTSMGLSNPDVECHDEGGLFFTADTTFDDDAERILEFEIDKIDKEVIIEGAYVSPNANFRGNGLGLMVCKCALALAHECSASKIEMCVILGDGFGFWSMLGALPKNKEEASVGKYIAYFLDDYKDEIDKTSIKELEDIICIDKDDPLKAWRELSQNKTRVEDGRFFKQIVFEAVPYTNANFYLHLDDKDTLNILEKHLGVIPDFSYLQNNEPDYATRKSFPNLTL